MKRRSQRVAASLATVLVAAASYVAWGQTAGGPAVSMDKQIAKLMADHKMTLQKAIDAAEREFKGQAISATTQVQGGKDAIVNVTLVSGETSRHVTVDVDTGKATEASAAAAMNRAAPAGSTAKAHDQPKKK